MGILNVTPDSFYDRGRYRAREAALARARTMADEGADLIDIGGEKAGPGTPVTVEEEIDRVCPIIEAVIRDTGLPVSVDTFKPAVARAAVEAGAEIVNSIGGFESAAMRRVCAAAGAAAVIMHIQGRPRVAHPHPRYDDVVREVRDWLIERATLCERDGIAADRICIDPGPGFGKAAEHDLALTGRIGALTALPYPVLLAVSRKSFLGAVLGLPVEDRLEGSLATAVWGVLHGVAVVRAHDVRATRRAVRMVEAVLDPDRVEPVA